MASDCATERSLTSCIVKAKLEHRTSLKEIAVRVETRLMQGPL